MLYLFSKVAQVSDHDNITKKVHNIVKICVVRYNQELLVESLKNQKLKSNCANIYGDLMRTDGALVLLVGFGYAYLF